MLGEALAGLERVTEREWPDLLARLAPVSRSYLRRLLRASGVPLDPLVEGVRQDSPAELERTLSALQGEYQAASESGDRERMRRVRSLVIEAKDHARLAARRSAPGKEEMIQWMLVWLENPPVFRLWLSAKKQAAARSGPEIER